MPHRVSISAATLPTPPMPTMATCDGEINCPLRTWSTLHTTQLQRLSLTMITVSILRPPHAVTTWQTSNSTHTRYPHRLLADALIVVHNAHPLQRHEAAVGVAVHHFRAHLGNAQPWTLLTRCCNAQEQHEADSTITSQVNAIEVVPIGVCIASMVMT